MMRHVIISDTHAPHIIDEIYEDVVQRILPTYEVDAIVINGDLLGIFSLERSREHTTPITRDQKKTYLKQAAPKWAAEYSWGAALTEQAVIAYVEERYEWVVTTLKKFSEQKYTLWNMGNHESPHHFLVLQELAFLTEQELPSIPNQESLHDIFARHEQQLALLELTHAFAYIRHKPLIQQNTLILPIPGESHDAIGNTRPAHAQEHKTKELIQQAKQLLTSAQHIIIYNHTQGDYDRQTGFFAPLSPAINAFIQETKVQDIIWIQSHNHWSFTQHIYTDNTHYILNNAGLQGGIYNLLEIGEVITVYDVHTRTTTITALKPTSAPVPSQDQLAIIQRNYMNSLDIFMHRKMRL